MRDYVWPRRITNPKEALVDSSIKPHDAARVGAPLDPYAQIRRIPA